MPEAVSARASPLGPLNDTDLGPGLGRARPRMGSNSGVLAGRVRAELSSWAATSASNPAASSSSSSATVQQRREHRPFASQKRSRSVRESERDGAAALLTSPPTLEHHSYLPASRAEILATEMFQSQSAGRIELSNIVDGRRSPGPARVSVSKGQPKYRGGTFLH